MARLLTSAVLLNALFVDAQTPSSEPPSSEVANSTFAYEATLPLPNYGNPCASVVVLNDEFANSYGHPANINYAPPADCPGFTHVTAQLNLSTYGYQYDRLMHLILNGVEMWRPSTPEPVGRNISSTESKDLSPFVALFKEPGVLQFSLDNIIASGINGPYFAELVLNFYEAPDLHTVSDDIWYYDTPPSNFDAVIAYDDVYASTAPLNGTIQQVSRNTTRAVLNVFASGNSNEEFWYANTLSQGGPTRMLEVYIDGTLAGVTDPFAVVYTGGVDPALWSPLLGLRASDVPSYIVDVTPFLPKLWAGASELTVAVGNGYNETEAILSNWIINAALLTWEEPGVYGSGSNFQHSYTGSGNATGDSEHINAAYVHQVTTSADLTLVYSGQANASYSGTATWSQDTSMSNIQNGNATVSDVTQFGRGSAKFTWASTNGTTVEYTRSHYYPLDLLETSNTITFNRTWEVTVNSNGKQFSIDDEQSATVGGSVGRVTIDNIWSGDYYRHAEADRGEIVVDTTST